MKHNVYIYILVMCLTSFLLRALPLTLIRKEIKNKYFRSFLYYVPYVTLAVMTFPAIMDASEHRIAGIASLIAGMAAGSNIAKCSGKAEERGKDCQPLKNIVKFAVAVHGMAGDVMAEKHSQRFITASDIITGLGELTEYA